MKNHIPDPWDYETMWNVWLVPAGIEMLKTVRSCKVAVLKKVFDGKCNYEKASLENELL